MNVQEAESKVCYDNTTIERPKEIAFGGKGKYCSIPCCKNTQYDRDWKKTNIALFKFPDKERKPDLYKASFNKIKTFRRKGGKDAFTVTNNTYVCRARNNGQTSDNVWPYIEMSGRNKFHKCN